MSLSYYDSCTYPDHMMVVRVAPSAKTGCCVDRYSDYYWDCAVPRASLLQVALGLRRVSSGNGEGLKKLEALPYDRLGWLQLVPRNQCPQ